MKKQTIIIVVLALFVMTVGAYSYWNSSRYNHYVCENGITYKYPKNIIDGTAIYTDVDGKKVGCGGGAIGVLTPERGNIIDRAGDCSYK